MTKEEYLKRSQDVAEQVFALARDAEEIVKQVVAEGETLTFADDDDYIYINDDNRVVIRIENFMGTIYVSHKIFDADDEDYAEETWSCLNPIDRLEIADRLAGM